MTWRTTERQWSVDIDSDLISFWIRPVNLICKQLMTLLHLELKVNDIWVESFNNFISLPFEICLCKLGLVHFSLVFSTSNTLEEGMVQAGSGVAGLSSSGSGFRQSFLESAFDVVQAIDYGAKAADLDELGALLPLPGAPDAHVRGGGGGGGEGGGGGRVVVVVTAVVVAVDVGSEEPDCDVVRSITRVVIRGIEEVS
uniref:Uncharacterized protein n=1 Tax=Tanacetum cinerariifolium TaxID=118510 RepID=A0A6L2MC72_TANCI|nr:hypothetical protein [Tanacetum cinerariifolium]